jgi:hypothetical protein
MIKLGKKVIISVLIIFIAITNLVFFKDAYDKKIEIEQYEKLISTIKEN